MWCKFTKNIVFLAVKIEYKLIKHKILYTMKKILLLLVLSLTISYSADAKRAKQPKVNNIIYMIGDGMGLSHVSMMILEGKYAPTTFDAAENVALIRTNSANNRVTDSAASGTALACGYKTNNSTLGMTPDGEIVESIISKAEKQNFATGLVVSCYLQHATPAAFYSHVKSRNESDEITRWFYKSDIDVAFGGGMKYFKRVIEKDGKDFEKEIANMGYTLHTDLKNVKSAPSEGKVLGIYAEGDLPLARTGERDGYLADATEKALEILTNNVKNQKKQGFVLMVEGSKIDGESHSRNPQGILAEVRDFANAIAAAKKYADANPGTLVVVCSDHETGGLAIPSNKTDFTLPESGIGYAFGTSSHTATLVPVYIYGTGAELINGVMDNTDLSWKLQEILGVGNRAAEAAAKEQKK